jgi:formate-dependent nitrite reductase cytochrome c552 subunit
VKQKTEFSVKLNCTEGLRTICKDCSNTASSQWKKDNPAKINATSARRRARKLKATPSWEDKRKTQWYYDESQRISQETGVAHHVDHMVL